MRRDAKSYLWDARTAAALIQRFVAGRTYEDYVRDVLLRSAVERQFQVVGEALGRLRTEDPELANRVPELRDIVAFRNILVHNYTMIDDRVVWRTIETDLQPLIDLLDREIGAA